MASGEYNLRIVILRRTQTGRTDANEPIEEWPEPTEGGRYSARRLSLNAGEEIRTGVNEGRSYMRVEIKGRAIPVDFADRIKIVANGQLYRVSAAPIRDRRVTVLVLESV